MHWEKLRRAAYVMAGDRKVIDQYVGVERPLLETDIFELSTDEVEPYFEHIDTSDEARQRADEIWAKIDAQKAQENV